MARAEMRKECISIPASPHHESGRLHLGPTEPSSDNWEDRAAASHPLIRKRVYLGVCDVVLPPSTSSLLRLDVQFLGICNPLGGGGGGVK